MRKLMIVAGLMIVSTGVYASEVAVRGGMSFAGDEKYTANGVTINGTASSGFSLGAEFVDSIGQNTNMGFGFEYLLDRTEDTLAGVSVSSYNSKFSFMPIYGTLQYCFPSSKVLARANVGYNGRFTGNDMFAGTASLTGGLYWALGLGTDVSDVVKLELMYSSYKGVAKLSNISIDFSYTPITLVLSYRFKTK